MESTFRIAEQEDTALIAVAIDGGRLPITPALGADQWAMNGILHDLFEALADTHKVERDLVAVLRAYRMPWQRRLLRLETPALAGLIELVVGLGAAIGRQAAAMTGR